jgi:hypothetical protein
MFLRWYGLEDFNTRLTLACNIHLFSGNWLVQKYDIPGSRALAIKIAFDVEIPSFDSGVKWTRG